MRNAGLYVRISQDREGAGLGVARQEDDCRALAERKGWKVVDVYADNDTSAYSGTPRPAWDRLIEDVKTGALDAVVCWHVDRLTRSPRELEDVIDLADRHGLDLATVTGEIDLANPTGRMVARILGAAARHESEHKAERQRRQRRQAAEAGKINGGGGTRPFGYADDRVSVIESEAEVIRECAARVLAGESMSSICRDLAKRNVRTPAENHWQPRTLRRLLASARISGRREHRPRSSSDTGTRPLLGEIVADVAVWPAIISPADSDRLRTLLSRPEQQKFNGATGRSYLLSGILFCGRCGHRMSGRPRSGVPRYVCPNMPGTDACGGIATVAERTDKHVRDLVLTALDSPKMAERLRRRSDDHPDLTANIREDEERLEELAADYAAGEITRAEWKKAREVIASRVDKAREKLARSSRTNALEGFIGTYEEMLARWKQMNVSQCRAVVSAVIERITVRPADPHKRWDPNRFDPPVWRV